MKSIRTKIILSLGSLIVVVLLLLGATSIVMNYNRAMDQLGQTLYSVSDIAAQRVEQEIVAYMNLAETFGARPDISNPDVSPTQKQALLNQWAKEHNIVRTNIIDKTGISPIDSNDYSDREYFIQCMNGNTYISTPILSKVTGELTIIVAAPIWENGIVDSTPVGVVYFVPQKTFLNDIMSSIHVSENSEAYMIDKDGYTIADITMDTVTVQNIENEATSNDELTDLANIHKQMRSGAIGVGYYKINGINKISSYAPVGGTDGWSLAVTAPINDFIQATHTSIIATIIIVIVSIILIFAVSFVVCSKIVNPIKACANRLVTLSQGDLNSPVPVVNSKDETKILADSTNEIVTALRNIINEEHRTLGAMASGNFDIDINNEIYRGDFRVVCESMYDINTKLSNTLNEINMAAEQVASGSDQVALGAQALSHVATEQASSAE